MSFSHRLPVVFSPSVFSPSVFSPVLLSSGMLLSASLLAVAQDVPRASRGATTPILTGTTLTAVESMDGPSFVAGFNFFGGQMTVNTLSNGRVLLGSPSKVFSNNGTGNFTTLNSGAVGTVQIPDLNGDGFPDFMIETGVTTNVFAGSATGAPSATQISVAAGGIGKLAGMPIVGDFNADGQQDVLVISTTSGTTTLKLFTGETVSTPGVFSLGYSTTQLASISDLNSRFLAQSLQWDSVTPGARDAVWATSLVTSDFFSSYTNFTIELRSSVSGIRTLASPTTMFGNFKVVSLTTGDLDGDGADEIALITTASNTAGHQTLIIKGGNVSGTADVIRDSMLVIVKDVTGDGLADVIGALPNGPGLYPGNPGILSKTIGFSLQTPTSLIPSRTFSDAIVGAVGDTFRPQAVRLLTPDAGNDPTAHQLLLADYKTVLVSGSSPLRPKVIPALQPSFTGLAATAKTVTRPNTPVTLCDPDLQLVFGDSGSVAGLQVRMATNNFFDDRLTFNATLGVPTFTIDPNLPVPVITYTFPLTGTVTDCATVLKSMQFSTSSSQTSGVRTVSAVTKAAFSPADIGLPYVSTVQIATVDATFNTINLNQFGGIIINNVIGVKAGGTLTFAERNIQALRGIPFGSNDYRITQQPTRGTAVISVGQFGGLGLTYTSLLTAGAGTDSITVDYIPGIQGGLRAEPRESVTFLVNNVIEPLNVLNVDFAILPAVGKPVHFRVFNGHGPYQVTVRGGSLRRGVLKGVNEKVNVDSDSFGTFDLFEDIFVTPTNPFNQTGVEGFQNVVSIDVTDADGNPDSRLLINVATPAAVTLSAPQIPVSVGGVTLFGAICPSTFGGVQSLRSALSGKDKTAVRAFAWDAATQAYAELPEDEPAGGLTPTTGVFLATRQDLGLNFSGVPSSLDSSIALLPGWNFVGLGPIDNNGTIEAFHPYSHFDITNEVGVHQSNPTVVSASPFYWDGAAYSKVSVMAAGTSYWIFNSSAETVLLVRKAAAVTFPISRSARAEETPPAPPSTGSDTSFSSSSSSSNNKADGGCGNGSGFALALAGLMACVRFARFRR